MKNTKIQYLFIVFLSMTSYLSYGMQEAISTTNQNDPSHLNRLLIQAIQATDFALVTNLLDQGANVNATIDRDQKRPLIVAAQSNNFEIVQKLIEYGAHVDCIDAYGDTPLIEAVRSKGLQQPRQEAQRNRNSIIEMLINRGANLNIENRIGLSALTAAIEHKYDDIAKMLITAGVHIKKESITDKAAQLICAAKQGFVEIAQILIKAQADFNQVDQYNKTALMNAAIYKHPKVASLLIAKGANVNAQDSSDGYTPLMLAANNIDFCPEHGFDFSRRTCGLSNDSAEYIQKQLELIKIFIDAWADPTMTTDDGYKAEDLTENLELKALLIAYREEYENSVLW